MAPNKLDNQIREKLNARDIQPSAPAWDRLDAMLAVSEEKKSKKGYGWFFVAASTLLFFGLGFFLFNANETPKIDNSNPIVTTNNKIDSVQINKIDEFLVKTEQSVLVQNAVNYSKTARNIKTTESKELIKSENVLEEKSTSNSQLPTPNSYKYVSPDELLAEAQTGEKVITSDKKIVPKVKMKVDANSLLTTVEKELDDNHRETTLDKLNRKFQDAKSALANRNYE